MGFSYIVPTSKMLEQMIGEKLFLDSEFKITVKIIRNCATGILLRDAASQVFKKQSWFINGKNRKLEKIVVRNF